MGDRINANKFLRSPIYIQNIKITSSLCKKKINHWKCQIYTVRPRKKETRKSS